MIHDTDTTTKGISRIGYYHSLGGNTLEMVIAQVDPELACQCVSCITL